MTPRGRTMTARSWQWVLEARVARRASALAEAIDEAGAVYLSERLHAVRIAVKKLRYALELSVDVAGQKSTPELTQLRRAQEVLGRLHDLQVLIDRMRETQASLTPPDSPPGASSIGWSSRSRKTAGVCTAATCTTAPRSKPSVCGSAPAEPHRPDRNSKPGTE